MPGLWFNISQELDDWSEFEKSESEMKGGRKMTGPGDYGGYDADADCGSCSDGENCPGSFSGCDESAGGESGEG